MRSPLHVLDLMFYITCYYFVIKVHIITIVTVVQDIIQFTDFTGEVREVLAKQRGRIASAKAGAGVNGVKDAGVPVEGYQEIMEEAGKTEQVGVVSVAFSPVQELPKPVDLSTSTSTSTKLSGNIRE